MASPDHTLSLQIPLLVLGTHTNHDYVYHPNPGIRTAKVLDVVRYTIEHSCEGVRAAVWQGREWDWRVRSDGDGEDREDVSDGNDVGDRGDEKGRETRREAWEGVVDGGGWVVRSGVVPGSGESECETAQKPQEQLQRRHGRLENKGINSQKSETSEGLGYIGTYAPGDGLLTPRQERKRRDAKLWSVPIVLQRFNISIDRTEMLMKEVRDIMAAFKEFLNWEIEDGLEYKGLKVVGAESGDVKICFTSGKGRGGGGKERRTWSADTVSKVLLAVTGFERETTLTSSMTSLLAYSPLSQYLTHWGIKQLRQERLHMLNARYERERGRRTCGKTEKERTGPHPLLTKEEDANEWTWRTKVKGDNVDDFLKRIEKPGVWKSCDDVWATGEAAAGKCVREMRRCEGRGVRLAVALPISLASSSSPSTPPTKKEEEEQHLDLYTSDTESGGDVSDSDPVLGDPPLRSALPEPFPDIEAIIFQGHRSSTNAHDLTAYIDLIAQLFLYASSHTYIQLRETIFSFRTIAADREHTPHHSLLKLIRMLNVRHSTLEHYSTYSLYTGAFGKSPKKSRKQGKANREGRKSPFDGVMKLLEKKREKGREYVAVFVDRYAWMGGWDAVSRQGLFALMVGEDEKRRKRCGAR